MSCKYCESEKLLNELNFAETYIENGELVLSYMDACSSDKDRVPINFCPMCGENLGDDE